VSWDSGYQLRIREKSGERIFPLQAKSITVGRAGPGKSPSFDVLLLDDEAVSRHHANLKWQLLKNVFMLHHKSETNPTLVNGEPSKRILLAPDDVIQMGDTVMQMERAGVEPPTVPNTSKPTLNNNTHLDREEPAAPEPTTSDKNKFVWKPPEER
jgi:pSer/pThr/pTyr-binding forkhead associated (FHA) protein